MPQVQAIQVEINLQDYFFDEREEDEREETGNLAELTQLKTQASLERDGARSPISLETWEEWFHSWIEQLQPRLSVSSDPSDPLHYELSLRLTDNAEIQQLNAQYRHHDQPTDVLAFAALESELPSPVAIPEQPLYLGDLVISVETAQQQAQDRGHSLTQELAWLASHGLLHLLGWDHPDEPRLIQMLNQQADLLQAVGISIQYD